MAQYFIKQADHYAKARPTYPPELFRFIASKTPCHDLVWDVGTGSGQAIPPLAEIFKNVIGTDTSQSQLELAPKLANVKYHQTPPIISFEEVQKIVAPQSTVDLVTIAQAIHWFDLPKFYDRVKHVLKKPNGAIAAWCYTNPTVDEKVDAVMSSYRENAAPYRKKPIIELVDKRYIDLYFPFEPVDGCDHTGPFEFKAEKMMSLEDFLTYLRSWSGYNLAKEERVELLTDEMLEKFKHAWYNGDEDIEKTVTFYNYLKIGKVGDAK